MEIYNKSNEAILKVEYKRRRETKIILLFVIHFTRSTLETLEVEAPNFVNDPNFNTFFLVFIYLFI